MTGPLAGITVVTLEQAVSAPLASRTLADLGARVIKVLVARDRWREVGTPGGPVPALLPPVGTRIDPVPALGEHTDSVLLELGLTDADIPALAADGVV